MRAEAWCAQLSKQRRSMKILKKSGESWHTEVFLLLGALELHVAVRILLTVLLHELGLLFLLHTLPPRVSFQARSVVSPSRA